MTGGVLADTHALIWYLVNRSRLSPAAVGALDGAVTAGQPVWISAVSIVEIIYLVEKGRLLPEVWTRVERELQDPAAATDVAALDDAVAAAVARIPRAQVPDMPDRIIAATALHLGIPLISRDGRIRTAGLNVIW